MGAGLPRRPDHLKFERSISSEKVDLEVSEGEEAQRSIEKVMQVRGMKILFQKTILLYNHQIDCENSAAIYTNLP